MTDWDNNYNKIRHQFECLVYSDITDIELCFDSSDTVIRIERVSVADVIDKREHGYAYSYKEFALVKIIPNGFVWYPIIAGYCDYQETIRTLYEGLLSFALNQSSEKQSHSDISLRMEMYNAFKSLLIERYINKTHLERDLLQSTFCRYVPIMIHLVKTLQQVITSPFMTLANSMKHSVIRK